ncbi:TonB-dependent receptor [Tamlana sp. 62-3]|uniref:TonB-dependent receptor n=1 Tax=Neotamlana sargassicola TaxID=2883125 RepID=A0A9X1L4H6_9FLAO|nr:TonB-dependent receptor [Tamlana sargassicola]MCB4808207.1 TonB-dependent receptor [Tamlana sargassicola]
MKKIITGVDKILYIPELSLKMKLTYILLFFALFQIQANNTFSQNVKVTLNCNNMPIEEVLTEIENKTEFKFLYEKDVFFKEEKINITSNEEQLKNILNRIFGKLQLHYEFINEQIIIVKNTEDQGVVNSLKAKIKQVFQGPITGKVTDESGMPLPGATIVYKGQNSGVTTDFDGNFSIPFVQNAKTLVVSYIGYETQEVVINNVSKINVQLKVAVTGLDETVIVAYGKIKKEALTGSVGVVNVEGLAKQGTIINVDQALQGQVAGVQVSAPSGKPGAAARVRVRGSSSILGTNQPLYVVDGVPISPSVEIPGYASFIDGLSNNESTTLENEGFNNDLGFLDFNNVESISVLKDATATSIYGSRAANGVIVITTKSGSGLSKPQFELSVTQRANLVQNIDVLNSSQYKSLYEDAINNYVESGGVVPTSDSFGQGILAGTEVDLNTDTDWQDLVVRNTSLTSNYAFSVRGGSDKGSYYSSLSLQSDDGSVKGDELKRYAYSLSLTQKLKDNLSFSSNINLGRVKSDLALNSLFAAFEAATYLRPDVTPYDEDGNLIARIGDIYNPLSSSQRRITSTTFSLAGNFTLEYEPIENLILKTTGILQYIDAESYSFYPSYTISGSTTNGEGNLVNRNTINPTVEGTLSYDFSLSKSNFNVLVGSTYQNENSVTNSLYGENFPNDDTLTGISYAGESLSAQESITRSTLISFFSRFIYDYDNRYVINFSGRTDGSSKFGANKRWATFPSVGLGWNIHNEKFMDNAYAVNFLKLRASTGQSGNVTFDPNQSFSLFGALNSTLGVYNGNTGVVPVRIGNPDLKWEVTTQKDLGLEFAFFNNRIKGEVAYYKKDTKDVLYQTELPSSSGLYTVISNLGDTQNDGYELTLNFNLINKKNFKWNFGFNAATANSKIVKLNTSYLDEYGGTYLNGLYLREGESLGLIRGFVANGLFQNQEQIDALNSSAPDGVYQSTITSPGDIYFADLDGDGEVSTSTSSGDVTSIGSIEPDFFGGINTNFNYKGLTLNIFANYSLGNDIYWKAGENAFSYTTLNEQGNKPTLALDRWTPDNTDAIYPRAVYRTNLSTANQNNRQSSLYVHKGDYLRIKNITLGYNFSNDVLDKLKIQGLYLYLTGTNLFTFTKYPGADPEFTNIASFRNPIDSNKYPVSKQLITGLRLTF